MKFDDEPEKIKPKGSLLIKACFALFGIASLVGWNSILSNIDLFSTFQSDLNPGVTISFLNYALNIPVQIFLLVKKKSFSLKSQLIISLIGTIICLISVPFSVLSFEKNSPTGITLTVIIFLLYGIINALLSTGFFALASYFPLDIIISLSTGQGLSGISLSSLEIILLFLVKTNDKELRLKKCAYIYFGISGLILIICLIALLIGFNTSYFKYYLAPLNESANDKDNIGDGTVDLLGEGDQENEKDIVEQEKKELSFKEIFKKLLGVNLMIFFTLMLTFVLYPYACINQNLFNFEEYNSIAIIIIFNISATLGRYTMSYFKPTQQLGVTIIIGRCFIIFSLFLNNFLYMKLGVSLTVTSILLIINVITLAFTNGFATSLCIALAPTYLSSEYKGKAGFSVSLFQIMGILAGSLFSFISKEIMQAIGLFNKK